MSLDTQTQICVPVKAQTLSELVAAAKSAASVGDIVELRLDALDRGELEKGSSHLNSLIHSLDRPVILTFRPSEQGGYRSLSKNDRLAFWSNYLHFGADFFDLEFDLIKDLINYDADRQPDWSRVICSVHNFEGIPQDLDELYERMSFTPARILKLAVKASDITDCIPILRLLKRARQEKRELIAIAMDDAGLTTRILGPAYGAFLTYAASEFESGTAPGQITAYDLKSVYRPDEIDRETFITGLVGSPVSQSVSPHMHNSAFKAAGLNGVYLPFLVHDLKTFIQRMVHPRSRELDWNVKGLSITAPHKTAVLDLLDRVDPTAQEIGAVNTIVLEDEALHGYNTDAQGFIQPLIRKLGSLGGIRAALLGSGGAANAVLYALQMNGVETTLYSRNREKAEGLAAKFNLSYEPLNPANFKGKDIVINATPLGCAGERVNDTPAVAEQLRGVTLVYDLVYNPIETQLLSEARAAGCDTLGGLEMLVVQAMLQFKLWTNTDTSYDLMYTAGHTALSRNSVHT